MKLWLSSLSAKAPIKAVVTIRLDQNRDYTDSPTLLNFYVRSMNDSITFVPKVEVSPSGGNVSPYLCPMDWMESVRTPAAFASKQSNVVVSGKCIPMVCDGQSGNSSKYWSYTLVSLAYGYLQDATFQFLPEFLPWNLSQTFSYCVEICDSNHTVLLRLLTSECLYRLKEWASTRGVIECPFVQKGREMTYPVTNKSFLQPSTIAAMCSHP